MAEVGETGLEPVPIALIAGELRRGGAERVLVNIANRLDRSRFIPVVVTTRKAGPLASDLNDDVECVSLNRRSRWDIGSVLQLAGLLKQRKIAIVHSHNHFASYFVRIARMVGGGRWRQMVHDHHGPAVGSKLLNALDRVLLKDVDLFVATSTALSERARTVIGLPGERVRILYNGIEIPPRSSRIPSERPTIVQVGRLTEVKNQKLAIRAAEILRNRGTVFRWLLIGDAQRSDYRDSLEREIESRGLGGFVELAGESADVGKVLARATVGILTSVFEGLSIAVLEYMAAGLPVVITAVGETAGLVRRAGGGVAVGQDDPEEIAEALDRLTKDRSLALEWGSRNRAYVSRFHSNDLMVNRLMDLYDELCRGESEGLPRKSKE